MPVITRKECVPSVGVRPDGRVIVCLDQEGTSLDMPSALARWLAAELVAAADRVDKQEQETKEP